MGNTVPMLSLARTSPSVYGEHDDMGAATQRSGMVCVTGASVRFVLAPVLCSSPVLT